MNIEEKAKVKELVDMMQFILGDTERILDNWAKESIRGGWSTHQVGPQRDLSDRIAAILYRANQLRAKLEI